MLPSDVKAAVTQLARYPSGSVEEKGEMDLVDGCHKDQIALTGSHRLVVDA